MLAPFRNTILRSNSSSKAIVMSSNLHDVNTTCGIDTDAGMSISTLREDFPCCLDESDQAKQSIEAPAGINGGTSMIGGRGPMIIKTASGKYLMDPDGIYNLQLENINLTFVSYRRRGLSPMGYEQFSASRGLKLMCFMIG
jgi:hypothetical protein